MVKQEPQSLVVAKEYTPAGINIYNLFKTDEGINDKHLKRLATRSRLYPELTYYLIEIDEEDAYYLSEEMIVEILRTHPELLESSENIVELKED